MTLPAVTPPARHDAKRKFLLLQVRNAGDPMRQQEVDCFAAALACEPQQITVHDLLAGGPSDRVLAAHDLVLIGGSGDYSAAGAAVPSDADRPADWLARAFDALRHLHALGKPTFASCWGFQAFCRAMGGRCVHDPANAELGPVEMTLTADGQADPLFGPLATDSGGAFLAHSGHEDRVTTLPAGAVLLASSARVPQQAVRFAGKPIYATQFHPELSAAAFFQRVEAYPRYVEQIAGVPLERFRERLRETPAANQLLPRFANLVLA